MKKTRVLFVSQEITPYLPESHMSKIARNLPQAIQEKGREIRTFMPRFGCINERRNQLHEVIRLSGMNLIIDDNDQPLIIKVASIQAARMQVYFIDNEEFFQRKATTQDKNEVDFEDNDERMLFFCKGVLETVKKLGWSPDIIHCHGWMTALLPVLIRRNYKDDPLFADSKVITSLYGSGFSGSLDHRLPEKMMLEGVRPEDVSLLKSPSYTNLMEHAISFSDGVILADSDVEDEISNKVKESKKPILFWNGEEEHAESCSNFYDEILLGEPVAELAN
jgi:starch synthase